MNVVSKNVRHRSGLVERRSSLDITVSTSTFRNRECCLRYISYKPYIISEDNDNEAIAVIVS
jgi:hypothetical protein